MQELNTNDWKATLIYTNLYKFPKTKSGTQIKSTRTELKKLWLRKFHSKESVMWPSAAVTDLFQDSTCGVFRNGCNKCFEFFLFSLLSLCYQLGAVGPFSFDTWHQRGILAAHWMFSRFWTNSLRTLEVVVYQQGITNHAIFKFTYVTFVPHIYWRSDRLHERIELLPQKNWYLC